LYPLGIGAPGHASKLLDARIRGHIKIIKFAQRSPEQVRKSRLRAQKR
jgi:hypothetical protein